MAPEWAAVSARDAEAIQEGLSCLAELAASAAVSGRLDAEGAIRVRDAARAMASAALRIEYQVYGDKLSTSEDCDETYAAARDIDRACAACEAIAHAVQSESRFRGALL